MFLKIQVGEYAQLIEEKGGRKGEGIYCYMHAFIPF